MLGKNKVQKNFKKEMKAIEKEILKKSQNNSGEPSNSFFNNDFYYQRDRSFGNKIKKFLIFCFHMEL